MTKQGDSVFPIVFHPSLFPSLPFSPLLRALPALKKIKNKTISRNKKAGCGSVCRAIKMEAYYIAFPFAIDHVLLLRNREDHDIILLLLLFLLLLQLLWLFYRSCFFKVCQIHGGARDRAHGSPAR